MTRVFSNFYAAGKQLAIKQPLTKTFVGVGKTVIGSFWALLSFVCSWAIFWGDQAGNLPLVGIGFFEGRNDKPLIIFARPFDRTVRFFSKIFIPRLRPWKGRMIKISMKGVWLSGKWTPAKRKILFQARKHTAAPQT
jgi:hypothetical protein